jgi:hypothetical protein
MKTRIVKNRKKDHTFNAEIFLASLPISRWDHDTQENDRKVRRSVTFRREKGNGEAADVAVLLPSTRAELCQFARDHCIEL